MTEIKKNNYIQLVCDATNQDYSTIQEKMDHAKSKLGVTYKEYYNNELFNMTPTQQTVEARRIVIRRNNRNERLKKISNTTGMSKAEIYQRIREINEKSIINMTIVRYAKYEVFRFEGKALDNFLDLFIRRDQLKEDILNSFEKIDLGKMAYTDIDSMIQEFYTVIESMMPDSLINELSELIQISYPELISDPEKCRKIAVDIEATRVLLPFSLSEYVSFHFSEKSIEEKRRFISDKERLEILNQINDPGKFDLLDNKTHAYELLHNYYGREMLTISSENDFDKFRRFCKSRKAIVVKPPCDTMGRGIKAIKVPFRKSMLLQLFNDLLEEYGDCLIEELIKPHKIISQLNHDSVNTVRVVTYFDGEKSIVHDSFMKVGQKGSFVDNGGAGGIFVHVDPKTGMLDSNGCDENGVIYVQHPHTKTVFNGYQLPDWDKAIALGLELSTKIPGLNYIGWDFTYTADNKWIVVEGNAKTQFYGQQCAKDIGVRDNFLKTIGYK